MYRISSIKRRPQIVAAVEQTPQVKTSDENRCCPRVLSSVATDMAIKPRIKQVPAYMAITIYYYCVNDYAE